MSNKIGFSHEYTKLAFHLFPTIRRYDRYPFVGTIHIVTSPNRKFRAILILKIKMILKDIPTAFLCYDTDTLNRKDAIKTLNSFYKNKIRDDEKLTILFLEKGDEKLWATKVTH